MASKKQQFPVNVPVSGVRKDVSKLRQTSDMAERGINLIYYDGVIRPRPALTPENFGTEDAQPWQLIYEDGDEAGYHMTAYCQMDDGTILANFVDAAGTGQKLSYSTDTGHSWQDTAHHPRAVVTTTFTSAMYIFGGKLFMFDLFWNQIAGECQPDGNAHVPTEYIYRTALTSFPTSVSWTTLGPVEWDAHVTDGTVADPFYCTVYQPHLGNIMYDEENDHIVASDVRGTSFPCTWGLADALTTADWAADSYHILGNAAGASISGTALTIPWFINKEWMAYGYNQSIFGVPYIYLDNAVAITSCLYRSSSGKYEAGDEGAGFTILEGTVGNNYSNFTTNISERNDLTQYYCSSPGVQVNDVGDSETLVVFKGLTIDQDWIHDVWKVKLAHPDDAEPHLLSMEKVQTIEDSTFEPSSITMGNISDRIVFFTRDKTTFKFRGISTDDDGLNWNITALGGPEDEFGYTAKDQIVSNPSTLQHFIGTHTIVAVPFDHTELALQEIWISPTTGGPGQFGDSTTLFQMDMDDEDSVVVQGTTKALLRLDRANAEWDRMTADHSETVGIDPWVSSGDIPPLTVSSDRAEYASGTTIDGTYGTHPWVFRSFETQGKTFLMATNGQCRPLCYHSDMAGGFARRMGEVPVGDPNDYNPWDADSWPAGYLRIGNLAPVARCMAVGANRVLLANLPSVSPYAVEVSGFNDPDRGWGLTQITLLGDTPGEIVALNEISALSVAMYKTDAIYQAIAQTEFLGVAAPFRFELSKAGISGPCSPGSVLRNFDGKHIYLARDGGVYMYDGVAPIDGGRNVRRMIQNDLNLNALGKTWGMVDIQRKLVWFFYPSKTGLVNKGIVVSTDQGYPWPAWQVQMPEGWDFAAGGAVFLEDDIAIGDIGRLASYGTATLGSFSSGEQQLLMGTRGNAWHSQKWVDDGDYTDSNLPIPVDLLTGWNSPGGAHRWTADELYHIFSSPDPELEVMITLYAQQFGSEILKSKDVPLTANRLRRRTRHRVPGTQFAMGLKGSITRSFEWGGGVLTAKRSGER